MSNLSNTRNNMDLIYRSFYRLTNLRDFLVSIQSLSEKSLINGIDFQVWATEGVLRELKTLIQDDWKRLTTDQNELKNVTFASLQDGSEELFGDHMSMEEWVNCVKAGGFIDDDGDGVLATAEHETNIIISPSFITLLELPMPDWATHVVWFNK